MSRDAPRGSASARRGSKRCVTCDTIAASSIVCRPLPNRGTRYRQIGQVRDGEPALQADVRACAVRDHLEHDVGLLAEIGQSGQLASHNLGRADRPVQDALIQQRVQQRRVGAGQESLPGQPGGRLVLRSHRRWCAGGWKDRPRLVGGLQQAGNQDVLEQPQRPGPGLVRAERPERRRVGQVPQAGLQPGERARSGPKTSSSRSARSREGTRRPVSIMPISEEL